MLQGCTSSTARHSALHSCRVYSPMMCSDKLRGIHCTPPLTPKTDHNSVEQKIKGPPQLSAAELQNHPQDTSSTWPPRWWGEAITAGLITSPQRPPVGIFEESSSWKGSSRGSMGTEEWGHISVFVVILQSPQPPLRMGSRAAPCWLRSGWPSLPKECGSQKG